jgi:diguanylate cyclase (GGDEF)-like protein
MEVALNNFSEAVSIKLIIGLTLITIGLWPLSVYVEFSATNYYLDIARILMLAAICWLAMANSANHTVLQNERETLQRKLSIQELQLSKTKDNAVVEAESLNTMLAAERKAAAINIAEVEGKLANAEVLLQEKATTTIDASTEVMTRQYFDIRFESEWQRAYRNQRFLSLLLIDIDDFTSVNLEHGVDAGDEVLQIVGAILAETIARASDVITYFGGDQFAVILPETELDGASAVADKLRQRVSDAIMTNEDTAVSLTVSIGGLSVLPTAPQSWKGALIKVNAALSDAKDAGKDTVKFSGVKDFYTR